jgi:hypothetical protein
MNLRELGNILSVVSGGVDIVYNMTHSFSSLHLNFIVQEKKLGICCIQ